jgi:hypothetical protein
VLQTSGPPLYRDLAADRYRADLLSTEALAPLGEEAQRSNRRSIERLYECLLHGYDRNQSGDTPIEQMFESLRDPG